MKMLGHHGSAEPLCTCDSPDRVAINSHVVQCRRCRKRVPDFLRLVPPARVAAIPEWRNDHGFKCCCGECVMRRIGYR